MCNSTVPVRVRRMALKKEISKYEKLLSNYKLEDNERLVYEKTVKKLKYELNNTMTQRELREARYGNR